MTQSLKCPNCNVRDSYDLAEVNVNLHGSFILCHHCFEPIELVTEHAAVRAADKRTLNEDKPEFKNGDLVVLINEEHPWSKELAIVREVGHKHYRIEILGRKVWVPFQWVASTDEYL